ncbi:MAG: nucleoside kinase [Candidatus Krumholzibacteriia bacterium]
MASDSNQVELEGLPRTIAPGVTILQFLRAENPALLEGDDPVVIASVNGRRVSLHEPLAPGDRVRLIRMSDPYAQTTIQRTVLFLLAVAAQDLFPDHQLNVHFSYSGGMYCELQRPEPLIAREISALEKRMWELVAEDRALTPQTFGLRALLKMYRRQGDERSYRAARYLRREALTFYRMADSAKLYYGRQLPSTGYVRTFRLEPEHPGFVLLGNLKGRIDEFPAYVPQPRYLDTLRAYARWTEKVGLQDTGSLNEYIVQGRTAELVQISEARHAQFFVDAARHVAALPEEGRLVLLAGPSSSGKTSSAKRIMVHLRVLGFKPFALSLDNYFVDRDLTPLGADGDFDFEALDALKIEDFNRDLQALMAGEPVHLPRFDFVAGKGVLDEAPTRLERGQPLIVEGIHALNPRLTPSIPRRDKLHIYVSALCHLNIDSYSYIKTTHSRLFRRLVRDAQFRGYPAAETLARWPKVRRGEEKHIFPFQNNADLFFNSGLTYELAVLKLWAEPRLAAVESDDPNYGLARTLIDLLALLLPIDAGQVPPTSLLREFIGGSGFRY